MAKKRLPRQKLAENVVTQLKKGASKKRLSREVAAYLIESGNTSELNSLLRDCMRLEATQNGAVEVMAASAHKLTDANKKEIESYVRGQYKNTRKVIIHEDIAPDVVGGISVSFPDSALDLSIRGKLNKLKALTS